MLRLEKVTHILFLFLVISLAISKAVTSLAIGLLLVTALVKARKKIPIPRDKTWVMLSPIVVFVVLALSLSYSEDIQKGLQLFYRQNTLLVFPFVFYVHQTLIKKRLSIYFQSYIYALVFAAATVLFFFLLPENIAQNTATQLGFLQNYTPQHERMAFGAYSPFIDRLQFGYLLGIAILLQLWQCFQKKNWWIQAPILGVLLIAFLILGARGAQLALLFTFPIWITFVYRRWIQTSVEQKLGKVLPKLLLGISILLLTVVLPYSLYKKVPAVSKRYDQLRWELKIFQQDDLQSHDYLHFTSIRRIMSWRNTSILIKEQPILGVGIGDYESELSAIYARDQLGFPVNSHQQLLYYWAAAGLLGIGSFLLSCLLFIWVIWKSIDESKRVVGLSFVCFFFIVFLLDVPLLYQVGSTGFYCFYLLLLIWMEIGEEEMKPEI